MEPSCSSKSLLNDVRLTALELQRLLTLSLTDGSDSCDFDSFTDLNPFSTLTSTTVVASSPEEIDLQDRGAYESVQYQAVDLLRAESLVQYSILQSACDIAESVACDAEEAVSGCWGLVNALKKLLELLHTEDLMKLCSGYNRAYQENAICEQNDSAKTPGRSRCSDLNQTDVFEIVEKICEQAEDERKTLEIELRKTRYDLDRAQDSHEVACKTITHIKTQLASENKRYACLENSFSEVMSIVRDVATELECSETGLSGLQIAQSLKRQVKGLLTAFPWLRSWKMTEEPPDELYREVNPYHILQLKEMELKEKVGTLEAATSFINDLGVELKDLKADRARLREELESKNLLIQRLREEGSEKSIQIDRYRATFDALFEPNTAANFAKQVAEQYRRYDSKSSLRGTTRSTSSVDAVPAESAPNVPRPGERHVTRYSSRQYPHVDAVTCANFALSPKPLLSTKASDCNKENVSNSMASKPLNLTQSNLKQQVCFNFGTKQSVKKLPNASPVTTDPKRIRLVEEPPKAFTSRIASSDWRKQPTLQAKYSHLNSQNQHDAEALRTSKPSPSCPLSSTENHDSGCPTS
ncbi:hypothetical protein TcWFU_007324 [Taenia crassiceps]|uniref:Uncharacterized protein n=1 Tax=Taenia crassiceps TaxID=6207 RepID=A0ABR4QS30_9CEST